MGGSQSRNIQKNEMSASAEQTHRVDQVSECNQFCETDLVIEDVCGETIDITVGHSQDGEGGDRSSSVKQTCRNHCSIESDLTSIADQNVNQDLMARLTQKAQATVKGVNLGNYSEALNYMDSSINASIQMTSEIDQDCVSTQMASNKATISNIGSCEDTESVNIDVENLEQTGINDAVINCSASGSQYATATQKLTSITSQSAIASTTGVSGFWAFLLLLLPFIGPVCVAWGASHVVEGLGSAVWIIVCIFFVIYLVSSTLTYYPLYYKVSDDGGFKENDRRKNVWNPIPYTKEDNPDNIILIPEIPFPREETLYTELKTRTRGSISESNLFIIPNSSIGDGGRYKDADEAASNIYMKGILGGSADHVEYPSWSPKDGTDGDYELFYYYEGTSDINPPSSATKAGEWGETPEKVGEYIKNQDTYIAFEWFHYFINDSNVLTELNYPLIVLYKNLPEKFWNWDLLQKPQCISSDPDGNIDPKCATEQIDEGGTDPCEGCTGIIYQQDLVDGDGKILHAFRPQTYLMNDANQSHKSKFLNEKQIRCPSSSSSGTSDSPYYPLLLTGNNKSSQTIAEAHLEYPGFDDACTNVNEENVEVVQKWDYGNKEWKIVEGTETPDLLNKKIHILYWEELEEHTETKNKICNLWTYCGSVGKGEGGNPTCNIKISLPSSGCPNTEPTVDGSGSLVGSSTMEVIIREHLAKAYGPEAEDVAGVQTGVFSKPLADRQKINHIIDSHDLSTIDIWTLDESNVWEKEASETCKWAPKSRDCSESEEKFGNKTHSELNAACDNTIKQSSSWTGLLEYSDDEEGKHCTLDGPNKKCKKKELYCKDVYKHLLKGSTSLMGLEDPPQEMEANGKCPTTWTGSERQFDSYKTINSQSQASDLQTTLSSSWSSMSQQEKNEMISQSMSLFGDETIMQTITEQIEEIEAHLEPANKHCEKAFNYASGEREGISPAQHGENVDECIDYCCIDNDRIAITSKNIYEGECLYNTSPMINRSIMPYMPTMPNTTGIKMFRDGSNMEPDGSAISFLETTIWYTLPFLWIILILIIIYTGIKTLGGSKWAKKVGTESMTETAPAAAAAVATVVDELSPDLPSAPPAFSPEAAPLMAQVVGDSGVPEAEPLMAQAVKDAGVPEGLVKHVDTWFDHNKRNNP